MMKPEIKTKWVEALRSGEYKQGKGYLFEDNCYCCLGVLCDLYSKDLKVPFSYEGKEVPPDSVIKWAGLPDPNPDMNHNNKELYISYLNDHAGLDFKELADLIEEQL